VSDKQDFMENRELYGRIKKKPFWKRWKCEHDWLYLGILDAKTTKVYFCSKCKAKDYRGQVSTL